MNAKLIVGIIVGALCGFLGFNYLGYSMVGLISPIILGLIIGFLGSQKLRFNYFLTSIILGALFYLPIAFQTNAWLDDLGTGAVFGLVIALICTLVSKFGNNS